MLRTRTAALAALLWALAVASTVLLSEDRPQRLLLAAAVAATTVAAIDRHAAQYREVVRLTLLATSFGRSSRVPAEERHADSGEAGRR